MNLVYGTVVKVFDEGDMRTARVRIVGALQKVPLDLVADAECGDELLICDGVAIAKANREKDHVPGDSR